METRPTVSRQVAQLIDRIRTLVAEQRRLDEDSIARGRREALRLEIARLQERLADMVRRELSEPRTDG